MTMFRLHPTTRLLAAAALVCATLTSHAMTRDEHRAAKNAIEADHKAQRQKCDALNGNAKDICVKEAKGAEDVAKAELEARYKPSAKATRKVAEAKADAAYAVAKQRCQEQSGNAKDVCEKDAKAAHVSAVENAKVAETQQRASNLGGDRAGAVQDARKNANEEKREANAEAAKERCDSLSGDAKSRCQDEARRIQDGKATR